MVQVQTTWFPLVDRNPQTFVPNIFRAERRGLPEGHAARVPVEGPGEQHRAVGTEKVGPTRRRRHRSAEQIVRINGLSPAIRACQRNRPRPPTPSQLPRLQIASPDVARAVHTKIERLEIVERYTGFQWLLPPVHDQAATSPVIVARAANTNTAVSRKTTHKRLPHWPRPQRKPRPDRPSRPSPLPQLPESIKRTSLGRPPLLAALSRRRGRLARSVAAEALRIERIVRINCLWLAVWAPGAT